MRINITLNTDDAIVFQFPNHFYFHISLGYAVILTLSQNTHAQFPFRPEEDINLPTGCNCAHANRFAKSFFILYGPISSESSSENRQTPAFI